MEQEVVKKDVAQKGQSHLICIGSDDITAIADADEKFHLVIYNATGNERLSQMVNALREQMYRYRLEHIKDRSKREELVKEHEMIICALEERDPVHARNAIRSHIQEQVEAVLEKWHGSEEQ